MVFDISKKERFIFDIVRKCSNDLGIRSYVVGGYVRDRIIGRPTKDMDIVCIGDGIQLAQAVARSLVPVPRVTTYSRFGTAMIKTKDIEIEFVGARKESYRYDSRKPLVSTGTLEDDQNRRDFTINAMAVSLNASDFGTILDPFGGFYHIEKKKIITPLDPEKTFSDDPLRMMRAIRFATQLKFTIAPETLVAIKKLKHRLDIVSKERIIAELNKIISADQPSVGFKLLFETGLLGQFFPEMVKLHGVEVRNGRAHKDNFYHTLQVLDNLSKNTRHLWLRWAAILHDIAKPPTKQIGRAHV